MKQYFRRFIVLTTQLFVLAAVVSVMPALAQSSSPNYSVDEYFFGVGGELDASSPNYRGQQSAGELGVGLTEGSSYEAQAGFNTTFQPFLEFTVNASTTSLGYLTTDTAATTTGTFTIRAYQSSGYYIYNASQPPTYQGETLNPLSSGGTSSPGTEQFGINLVDNSSPNVGANVVQSPDSSFSFGAPAANYGIVNTFRYNVGETIASSSQSSGASIFTVSYLYNISPLTPAGLYVFNHDLVAVASY
jgi:hypothetical protein